MEISAAVPTFLIAFREGVEAALVVGIVLALLQKANRPSLRVWVLFGVLAGLGASGLVGWLLNSVLTAVEGSSQPFTIVLLPMLKVIFSLTAIIMLTWMLVWMTQQSRTAKVEIEGSLTQVLQQPQQAKWGVLTLVFVAVLREGIETALFTVTQFQQGWLPVAGAGAGILAATGVGWCLFALGVRINLKQFFQVMGFFLLLIMGGLVIGTCKQADLLFRVLSTHFDWAKQVCFSDTVSAPEASCLLGPLLWDGHLILPDRQFPGILLKTLLGYRERLFLGQLIAYVSFLSLAGTLYWRGIRQTSFSRTPSAKTESAQS